MPIIRLKSNAGLTLVELMIAVALLGIISLGMVGVFGSVSKGIQFSKDKTLASNLCQEQMQILKAKSIQQSFADNQHRLFAQFFSPDSLRSRVLPS